jgi:hypothetical protein
MPKLLVLANEATASQRRVYFHLVDATDGITPETGEAGGQPQVSSDGAAFTNTGIGTLSAIGNGRYYADLTQAMVATAGTLIETRYKSANTAECPGDSVQVVAFDPNSASNLGLSSLPDAPPGAAGGVFIAGSNAATTAATWTVSGASVFTGNVSYADGLTIAAPSTGNRAGLSITGNGTGPGILATSGTGATGDGIKAVAASTNGNGINALGVGTGDGMMGTGGATGRGIHAVGGATSGSGFKSEGTAGNAVGVEIVGQGSAAGFQSTGGATGTAMRLVGGGTSGAGITIVTTSGNGISIAPAGGVGLSIVTAGNQNGITIAAAGSGTGISVTGGATGAGMVLVGGGTSGDGLDITTTSGHGISIAATGASKHGVLIAGGNSGTSDGLKLTAGTGGVGFRLDTLTASGAVSLGSTLTVTGATSLAALSTSGTATFNALTVTGAFTAGSNALPWNAAWDAEVESEASDALTAFGASTLDAAGVRTAVGLATANLDTQLDGLPTAAEVTTAVWAAAARTLTAIDEDSTTLDLNATIAAAFDSTLLNKIADRVLRRVVANIEASADGDPLAEDCLYGILRQLQKSNTVDNPGFLTIYKADGTTELAQLAIDPDAAAEPTVGIG